MDLGGGYALLRAREQTVHNVDDASEALIRKIMGDAESELETEMPVSGIVLHPRSYPWF
jgi:hypothetical protein